MLNFFSNLMPNAVAPSLHGDCDKPSVLGFYFMKNVIIGQRFGKWVVIKTGLKTKHHHNSCLCVCDCGKEKVVNERTLIIGTSVSCGCGHGLSGNKKLYAIWMAMKTRCYKANCKSYKNYGGRGISICDSWKNDFAAFYNWAISNGYSEGLEIDRINNNGNYSPENCRFVSRQTNLRNRRTNHLINYLGQTKTLIEWCEIFGRNQSTVLNRIYRGWSIEKALTKNPQ